MQSNMSVPMDAGGVRPLLDARRLHDAHRTTVSPALSPADFHFDRLTEQNFPKLRDWLRRTHVAEWWGDAESIEELRSAYILGAGEPSATRAYIARLGDEPIGFIQSYVVMGSGEGWWEDETDPGARGIDQFLAEVDQLNQGLGRRMIRAYINSVFSDPAVSVVQTDPHRTNLRAIRLHGSRLPPRSSSRSTHRMGRRCSCGARGSHLPLGAQIRAEPWLERPTTAWPRGAQGP